MALQAEVSSLQTLAEHLPVFDGLLNDAAELLCGVESPLSETKPIVEGVFHEELRLRPVNEEVVGVVHKHAPN